MKAMRMLLTSLVLLPGLTTLVLGQEGQCGGIQSIVPFNDMLQTIEYHSRCSYPTDKLNVSCILSSCPLLRGVCPLANQTAHNTAVSIINQCVGQSGLVCGLNLSHTPIIQISWTTAQLVPLSMVNGTIRVNPGTGYINSLSKASFALNHTANPNGTITMVIEAIDITCDVQFNSNFSLSSTSAIKPFTSVFSTVSSSLDFFNTPHMHGIYHLNLSSTVSIDLKPQPPVIQTIDLQFNILSYFSNIVTLNGVHLPPIVEQLFKDGMNTFLKQSVIPSTAAYFLSTYAALALQGAQEGCP